MRRVLRTAGVGVVTGAALRWVVLPTLDALGRTLLMPPSYGPAARILLVAFWVAGVAAAWAYRPAESPPGDRRSAPR